MTHAPELPRWLSWKAGVLYLDEHPLEDIVDDQTPSYIYSRTGLRERVSLIREQIPPGVAIKFAVKANPFPDLIDYLDDQIDAFDLSSQAELQLCKDSDKQLSYSGPSKSAGELKAAVEAGVTINIESINEIQRLQTIDKTLSATPKVAIRVNPLFTLVGTGLSMAGRASQFGIDREQVALVARSIPKDWEWCGYHYFGGSQCLDANALQDYYAAVVDDALSLAVEAAPLTKLNLGLSLGIPYHNRDASVSINQLSESIHRCFDRLKEAYPDCELQLETGRYLVGEAGVFVTKVVDVKSSRGQKFIVCDGGMNHFLAATGNLGQVIPRNFPIWKTPAMGSATRFNVVGPLCTPLDTLGRDVSLSNTHEGEFIVVGQAGAYGASASPQKFLSRDNCKELLV